MTESPFLWGVATASYQVEGGINTSGGPANNWAPWDASGRVQPCGAALSFWARPERLLDLAAATGCNAFRLSLEWARVQPAPDAWDAAALDRYAEILSMCRTRGLEPVVTLQHFTHPLWAGQDLWLDHRAPDLFASYCWRCVDEIGRRLEAAGQPQVRWWITINEPAVVPAATYLLGMFPGTGWGPRRVAAAFDHTLAAHVRGYDAVHDVYEDRGWGQPLVSTNFISLSAVNMDAVAVDAMLLRERGVPLEQADAALNKARVRARRRVAGARRRDPLAAGADAAVHRVARSVRCRAAGAAVSELYRSRRPRKLDYLSLDLYDAVVGNWLGPARPGARALRKQPGFAELWEQECDPGAMAVFLRQAHLQAPDRPILVAENGMCTPGPAPRPDGLTRDRYLPLMCGEVLRAREEGIPVAGYVHWTIADNYEWGSYRPRFGIHGVERDGEVRILATDAMGCDAAGAYRDVITGSGRGLDPVRTSASSP